MPSSPNHRNCTARKPLAFSAGDFDHFLRIASEIFRRAQTTPKIDTTNRRPTPFGELLAAQRRSHSAERRLPIDRVGVAIRAARKDVSKVKTPKNLRREELHSPVTRITMDKASEIAARTGV
jgi:hypothetical protein